MLSPLAPGDAAKRPDELARNLDLPKRAVALVLAGGRVYKMNYALMLADHVEMGLPCTVGCLEVPREQASDFGVMAIDEHRRILDFIRRFGVKSCPLPSAPSSLCPPA